MKGLLIPLVMALLGAGIGGGAAFALKPAPAADDDHAEDAHGDHGDEAADHGADYDDGHGDGHDDGHGGGYDEEHGDGYGGPKFHKIENQFVVPVIEDGRTRHLVVMTLALDIGPELADAAIQKEPRLRDALLRVLFDHANTGGFSGPFTEVERFDALRGALLERARGVAGSGINDVLILNVARQET